AAVSSRSRSGATFATADQRLSPCLTASIRSCRARISTERAYPGPHCPVLLLARSVLRDSGVSAPAVGVATGVGVAGGPAVGRRGGALGGRGEVRGEAWTGSGVAVRARGETGRGRGGAGPVRGEREGGHRLRDSPSQPQRRPARVARPAAEQVQTREVGVVRTN